MLADAQVDLTLTGRGRALRVSEPVLDGGVLADEFGRGKTIEAGLLLAQTWAVRKRRLLVILPANLRKQWSQELENRFYLPSVILKNRSFNEAVRFGKRKVVAKLPSVPSQANFDPGTPTSGWG